MKTKIGKILALPLLILGFSCVGFAQQEAQFTQYMFNRLSYNPGYAGSSGSICATLMYRNQWLGFGIDPPTPTSEAGKTPQSLLFSFDMPVKFLHGGIGLVFSSDKIGYHSSVSGHIDYAFRIYWGPGNLAAAIEGSFYNSTLQFSQLFGSSDFTGNYNGPTSSAGDPLISSSSDASDMLIDLSTGLYYQVPGTYYFGFSIKNLLGASSEVIHFKNSRVFYLVGGYEYAIPANPSFKLKPSGLLKTADFYKFQIDLSCLLDYQNLLWGGVNYRFQDAVSVLAGVNYNKLRIGLSYDLTTSKIGSMKNGRSFGTIEVYLRYCFKVIVPPKPPSIYRNTRILD